LAKLADQTTQLKCLGCNYSV